MNNEEDILKSGSISALNKLIAACKRCSLYKTKNCDVSGGGNLKAKILFIGEAPGKDEDLKGKPFVGRAGKLLDELFLSIKMSREKVFITNLVKHRPPKNRKPQKKELKECLPYLLKQIEIIKPELIVLLGSFSLSVFFPKEKISKSHGQFLKKDNQIYLSLYHPAAVIYNQKLKKTLIRDFKKNKGL